ncbi:hypothetical protein TNCV_4658361 [Trichonephila clavipes]|nr:hypothetical protein TNCV_4658361 [Trichonephila clavipes]
MGTQVASRNYPPTNKNTLIRALTEEGDKLPQQLLDNLWKVQGQMFRSGGQSDAKTPTLCSQAFLVIIYRPTEGMEG